MIIDKIKNIDKYAQLSQYSNEILGFIKRCEKEELSDGKYQLIGEDKLFALVQSYNTKSVEGALYEAHKRYADLQYIVAGNELIYYTILDNLELTEDRTPDQDILFYDNKQDNAKLTMQPGFFAYFDVQDAHMPCIQLKEGKCETVKKIVFKVLV